MCMGTWLTHGQGTRSSSKKDQEGHATTTSRIGISFIEFCVMQSEVDQIVIYAVQIHFKTYLTLSVYKIGILRFVSSKCVGAIRV